MRGVGFEAVVYFKLVWQDLYFDFCSSGCWIIVLSLLQELLLSLSLATVRLRLLRQQEKEGGFEEEKNHLVWHHIIWDQITYHLNLMCLCGITFNHWGISRPFIPSLIGVSCLLVICISCGAGHTKTLTKKQKTVKSTENHKKEKKYRKTGVCVVSTKYSWSSLGLRFLFCFCLFTIKGKISLSLF